MQTNINYAAGEGEWAGWLVEERRFDARHLGKCEAIFSQGNGYLGLRNALEERYVGETRNLFVNGTFDRIDENEVTELPNLPDITTVDLLLNGHRLHLESGSVSDYSRVLNLRTGETLRRFVWTAPDQARYQFVFRRFVSMSEAHLIGASVEITALSGDAVLEIQSGIRGDVTNSGAQHFHEGQRRLFDGLYLQLAATTMQSGVHTAVHATHRLSKEAEPKPRMDRRGVFAAYRLTVKRDEAFRLEKLSCVHTSRDMDFDEFMEQPLEELKARGMHTIREVRREGYDALLSQSVAVWEQYWRQSDIQISCDDPFYQLGTRFALYHLNIMVHPRDNRVGIGGKAMSGEGYKGHSFWDTEIFILPYYTFCHPHIARTLLEYRYKNLYGAHLKAAQYKYEGAMYPWESAWVSDGEVAPLYGGADIVTGEILPIGTGIYEHHISADIAYAVWQYFQVTGDQDYMIRYGYEIILDTALFWASRLEYNQELDRYEILDVIGPDEYKEHVDNNAYTNYMAHWNMNKALALLELLESDLPDVYSALDKKLNCGYIRERITARIDKLYLPVPNKDGIVPQNDQYLGLRPLDLSKYKDSGEVLGIYDDYNPEQMNLYMVSKQSDLVMLLFMLDDLFERQTAVKNFLFYEAHTLHDSSLSHSTHCVMAARLDLLDLAIDQFHSALGIDLGPWMHSSDAGVHSASMGGIWQGVVMGFGGLRVSDSGELILAPRLPAGWNGFSFRFLWQGCPLEVRIQNGQVQIRNEGAGRVALTLYRQNKKTVLEAQATICIQLEENA